MSFRAKSRNLKNKKSKCHAELVEASQNHKSSIVNRKYKMSKYIKTFVTLSIFLTVSLSFSQERENDTIDTDVVNVVKPYTPTISDAFKVKETPTLDDEETSTKKDVKYNIFSIPVASTFTPAKGKAADVEKAEGKTI